jgi:FkbM family methyltransferase
MERLMQMRWFPLMRTYRLRSNWMYDVCRIAGTREFTMLFDVGANIGQTAKAMVGFFPDAAIHAFEPVSGTFLALRQNVRRWPNVHAHRLAMGRKREFRDIEIQACSELNSLIVTPKAPAGPAKVERVEVATLDEFCAEHGIEAIDVIKTDAQGSDLDVLAGGDNLLSSGRIVFVYAEVSFQADDCNNTLFPGVNELLVSHHFRLFGFYEQFGGTLGGRGYLQFCNALYVNPEALKLRFWPSGSKGPV